MKTLRKITVTTILLLLLTSCSPEPMFDCLICAHRGYHTDCPENSLTSFRNAANSRLQWAECDIWCTSDNQLVVTHDKNLSRVYGTDLDVTKKTLAEIRLQTTKEQVPTLQDIWDVLKGRTKLQIEVKDINAVQPLLNFFSTNKCKKNCIVISFNATALEQIKTADKTITCGILSENYSSSLLNNENADIIALDYSQVTQNIVTDIHNSGRLCYVWTVDSLPEMTQLSQMGVDAITTNYPQYAYARSF